MKNSILILFPRKENGVWVFDDDKTGLVREAFVSGIDKIIDYLTAKIPSSEKGFRLFFSPSEFPESQIKLEWRREEFGGNWYWCEAYQIEGWLCPALYLYFEVAPKTLFAKAEAMEILKPKTKSKRNK